MNDASVFAIKGGSDCAFTMARPYDDGCDSPRGRQEDIQYIEWCIIPLHKYLFSLIDFCLHFNDFEMYVLNHLLISFSQLHIVNLVYIKVFQYCCVYKNGVPTVPLFLHFFNLNATLLIRFEAKLSYPSRNVSRCSKYIQRV